MKKEKEMQKNTNNVTFGMLVFVCFIVIFTNLFLFVETKKLQIQIDELKIIVDQKFLPAMILDKENLTVR